MMKSESKNKHFPICSNFKWHGIVALVLISAGIIALLLSPFGANMFNFDIDFAGGTTLHYAVKIPADQTVQNEIKQIVENATGINVSSIQSTGDGTEVIIKTLEMDTTNREKVFTALSERYGLTNEDRLGVDNVSSTVGKDMQKMAISASLLACFLILVYVTIRFDLRSGIAAIISLVFAIFVIISSYVVFQIPMNMNFIAAALTILGYSINATIVVFDRIRENNKRPGKEPFPDIVDRSIWQTMARSINTSITTIIMITMLIVFGVPSIQSFGVTLLIGVVFGGYASVFLAGPIWAILLKKFPQKA